jgi:hypothetical protein
MWCVAELDEEYMRRMEDVLAVYENTPSEGEPVVCIDKVVGSIYSALYTDPWQLAKPGRDRNQPVQSAMPRAAQSLARLLPARGQSLEPKNEPWSGHHQLALHSQKGTSEVRLQKKPDYAVRDLVIQRAALRAGTIAATLGPGLRTRPAGP